MSQTTRTNRATNPSAATVTGYAAVAGTSGTAALTNETDVGYGGGTKVNRVTWTVATSAISGGMNYTQDSGLSASTQYSHQLWVRPSKNQTMRLTAQYRDAANANVGAATNGTAVAVLANIWTQLTVTATSGLLVNDVVLSAAAFTGGSNWANGDFLDVDAVCIETAATPGDYFDGGSLNGVGIVYAWTGTANASTSTALSYTPNIGLVVKTDDPTDRVEITITDVTPNDNVVNLWRTADGERVAVQGGRGWVINTANAITDSAPPLGRLISYDLEVLSGDSAGVATPTANTTVNATHGWIQDPLVPANAVPLYGDVGPGGEAGLDDAAIKNIEYVASTTLLEIMGSTKPIALIGQRQEGSGISLLMTTDSAAHAKDLRDITNQAAPLLVRPLPEWSSALPGICYLAIPKVVEMPENEAWGGTTIHWDLTGDLVAAPSGTILVPLVTYTDVAAIWTTYQQAQNTLSSLSRTYLDILKSPSGA